MAQLRASILFVFLCSISTMMAIDDEREMLCSDINCDDYECPDTEECVYGKVPDVCFCCYTCAKGPGEQCGGMFDLAGICMDGFYCEPHPKYPQLPGMCYEKLT